LIFLFFRPCVPEPFAPGVPSDLVFRPGPLPRPHLLGFFKDPVNSGLMTVLVTSLWSDAQDPFLPHPRRLSVCANTFGAVTPCPPFRRGPLYLLVRFCVRNPAPRQTKHSWSSGQAPCPHTLRRFLLASGGLRELPRPRFFSEIPVVPADTQIRLQAFLYERLAVLKQSCVFVSVLLNASFHSPLISASLYVDSRRKC